MKFHKDKTDPKHGEIFVFGSNLLGIHGAGAARKAHQHFGAVYDEAKGPQGQSYAIPTKGMSFEVLPLHQIAACVAVFLNYARASKQEFWVTRIGCGLAGYRDAEIAPMFRGAPDNCSFAEAWRPYLTGAKK